MTSPSYRPDDAPTGDEPLGVLVHQLSEQVPELIRSELRLAQAELAQKGKRAGTGIGMFSVAGLLGFFGIRPAADHRRARARPGAARLGWPP